MKHNLSSVWGSLAGKTLKTPGLVYSFNKELVSPFNIFRFGSCNIDLEFPCAGSLKKRPSVAQRLAREVKERVGISPRKSKRAVIALKRLTVFSHSQRGLTFTMTN